MSQPDTTPQGGQTLKSWNAFLGTPACSCPSAWKSLGRLYGVSCGKGWVRLDTDPKCPYHGEGLGA